MAHRLIESYIDVSDHSSVVAYDDKLTISIHLGRFRTRHWDQPPLSTEEMSHRCLLRGGSVLPGIGASSELQMKDMYIHGT